MKYKCCVHNGDTLKEENPLYYWQAQSHMAVTGAEVCVFVVFNPFLKHPLHHFMVRPDADAMAELEDRVTKANEYINNLYK